MSVLSFPRLYFNGYTSWDPNISNNTETIWDPVGVDVVLPPNVTLDTYEQWVMNNASSQALGDWNIFGSHDCNFVQYQSYTTTITGGDAGSGMVTSDGVIGQPLSIAGKLVDLDPRGSDTSQYFFDNFSIGSGTTPLVSAPGTQQMHSRWLNFARNLNTGNDPRIQIAGVAAVLWQTTFPTASLQIDSSGSSLLGTFVTKLQGSGVQGLMLRFVVYRTLYFQNGVFNNFVPAPNSMAALQQLYSAGQIVSNPAYSVVTGSIGLWMENELVSMPCGRYLAPNENINGVAPAVAELNTSTNLLSLDFSSALPETDFDLDKQPFGPLAVTVGSTQVATLTEAQYGRTAYQATGGIIDIPVPNSSTLSGPIAVTWLTPGGPIPLLTEEQLTVQTDQKNFYLDEGDTVTVTVYVSDTGQPAAAGTLVQVAEYPWTEQGPTIDPTPLTVGANGLATFTVKATTPGYRYFGFTPYAAGTTPPAPPATIDSMAGFYCGARTLPFDDALNTNTPDWMLTWDWIYTNVLQAFDLNPAAVMRALGFGLSAQSIWDNPSGAADIQTRIAKSNVQNISSMPVTRDLSNGKRALLDRWANLVINGTAPVKPAAAKPTTPPRKLNRLAIY
jgi:hypothetical protein